MGNSKVTLELRELLDNGVNPWDFEYPSYYKGDAKTAFENKVNDHFLYRQIGSETVGRFLHFFRRTVREIMPYYIQRYESVDLMKDPEIRPLDNYNMIEEFTSNTSESGNESSTVNGTSNRSENGQGTNSTTSANGTQETTVHSDTPQGEINMFLNTGVDDVLNAAYASDVNQVANNSLTTGNDTHSSSGSSEEETTNTGTASTTKNGETEHRLTRRGNIGVTTYAQLLEGYRQTFLNIDMEIINELESCFLGVY